MDSTPPSVGVSELDETQRAALHACAPACRISVVGAPGTGKTTVLSAVAQREVMRAQEGSSGPRRPMPRIAILTQDRRAAAELRTRLSLALGGLPDSVAVQTLTAFAFTIVQTYSQAVGRRDPELISGPDEDALLAAILTDSEAGIEFPPFVTEDVRSLPGFRAEIRNLITRAAELGYGPAELEALGKAASEPMWISGAQVMRAYEVLTEAQDAFAGTSSAPDRLDHAQLVGTAASLLARWEENVAASPAQGQNIPRPRWDWILMDDIQNAPRSALALLNQLALDGASLVVAGDPDSAVQGFRGGVASLPGDVTQSSPRGIGCTPVFLGRRHRGGEHVADLADNLTQRIRVGGALVTHRRPTANIVADQVSGQRFVHGEEETAAIARMLRMIHHREAVPYTRMAIITRSRASHPALRGSLIRRGVPVEQIGSDQPLRFQPAVASLLDVVRLALRIPGEDGIPELRAVLISAIVGIDPLHLRRMCRTLRGYEVTSGGNRNEERLLELVLEGPQAVQDLAPHGVGGLVEAARLFAGVRSTASASARQAEEVLWAAWEASGRAEIWRAQALEGGISGDHADASLDAIIQLFRVAQRMADRDPETTIEQLLKELSLQDLPEDSIARTGAVNDAVTLTTPSASQGREWDVVVIAGLQDGAWPNLRLRDTYTHTSRLAQIATGRETPGASTAQQRYEAFQDILDDELRQLNHALGRARQRLILTCVDSDDAQPSRFFEAMGFHYEEELVGQDSGRDRETERHNEEAAAGRGRPIAILRAPRPQPAELDMAGLVGQIRRARSNEETAAMAESMLKRLADDGVIEAQPRMWFDELEVTPDQDLGGEEQIFVSPSRVENLLACPLRGFLSGVGAEDFDNREAARVGTLIHSLAEALPHGTQSELLALFDSKWRAEFEEPEYSFAAYRGYMAAQEMVRNLALYLAAHPEPVASERRIRVNLEGNIVLSASLDRVVQTEQGVHIADFKTGKNVPSSSEIDDHVQMQLYQWAVTQLPEYGKSAGAELVYLSRYMKRADMPAIKQQPPLDEEGLERARQRIQEAADILGAHTFAANPAENLCRNCQFLAVCPAKPEGRMFS
ncbi:ATP-dependent DNA helicase [Actinomycetaceae bacterium L2_0104]